MKPTRRFACLVPIFYVLSSPLAHAAVDIWVGNTSTDWNNAGNWNPATLPVTGDSFTFDAAGSAGTTLANTFAAGFNVAGMTFNSGAAAYTMAGNAITLSGDITNNSSAAQTINQAIALSGTRTVTTSTGNVTLGGIISSTVPTDGLIKAGTGTLTLSGANTFSSQLVISAGTLKAGNAAALGAGGAGNETVVQSGGTLDVNGQALTVTETISIAGSGVGGNGALVNTGAGQLNALNKVVLTADASVGGTARFDIRVGTTPTLDLAGFKLTKVGANDFHLVGTAVTNGNIDINAGIFAVETTSTVQGTGTITIASGGTLGLWGNATAANFTRDIVSNGGTISNIGSDAAINSNLALAAGTTTVLTGTNTTTLGGILSGTTGAINKTGTGSFVLSGANTYGGGTAINGGYLTFANAGAVPTTGMITINAGGALVATGAQASVTGWLGSGKIVNTSSGSIAIAANSAENINFAGFNNLSLSSTGAFIYSGTLTAGTNGYLFGGPANTLTVSSVLGGSGTTLTKTAASTVNLIGANTYTGGTTVNGGVLSVGNNTNTGAAALGTGGATVNTGGTLQFWVAAGGTTAFANNFTLNGGTLLGQDGVNNLNGTIAIGDSGGTFKSKWNNKNLVVNGVVSGSGLVTINREAGGETGAKVIFTNTNSYTGGTKITDGFLAFSNGALGTTGTITMDGGTLQWNGTNTQDVSARLALVTGKTALFDTNGNNVTFGTAIGNSTTAALTKAGAGTLTLAGANTYTGVTNINGGSLVFANAAVPTTSSININAGGSLVASGAQTTVMGWLGSGKIATTSAGSIAITGDSSENINFSTGGFNTLGLSSTGNATYSGTFTAGTGGYRFAGDTGANLTVSSSLGGSGTLTKTGAGFLTLSGANSYTGATTVSAGRVQFTKQTSFYNNQVASWTAANLTVAAGATASFNVGGANEFTSADIDLIKGLSNVGAATATLGFRNGSILGLDTSNATGGNFTYAGAITNHVATVTDTLGLNKLGVGTLTLTGANTYTGSTIISAGTLEIGGGGTLGGGAYAGVISGAGALLKSSAGILALSATNTYTGGTTVSQGILDLTGGGGANGTIRGVVTVNSGATLRLSTGDATGYDGTTRLSTINLVGGTLNINSIANQTLGSATINMTGAAITGVAGSNFDFFAGASALNTLASSVTSTISGVQLSPLRQGNTTFTVAKGTTPSGIDLDIQSVIGGADTNTAILTLTGGGTIAFSGTNTITGSATKSLSIAAGTTLLVGNGGATGTLGGLNVTNNSTLSFNRTDAAGSFANIISGTGQVRQIGTGTTTLTGVNTYTGTTTVTAGSLRINGSTAAGSTVSVASGATLGGSGTIGGSVNVTGVLAPGNSIESLATGSLTLNAGSALSIEIQDTTAAGSDLVAVAGDFTLNGLVALQLSKIGTAAWSLNDKLTLASYTGVWNNGQLTYGGNAIGDDAQLTFDNQTWTLNYNDTVKGTNYPGDANGSYVTLTAIPEPASMLLGGLGLLALLRRRRER